MGQASPQANRNEWGTLHNLRRHAKLGPRGIRITE
jgi:hypothetical protein